MVTALIVSNDKVTRKNGSSFTDLGAIYRIENNGKAAVELFKGRESYNLVVIDSQLTEMDKLLQAAIAQREKGVRCVIAGAISSDEKGKKEDKFLSAGFDVCYVKPVTPFDYNDMNKKLGQLFN